MHAAIEKLMCHMCIVCTPSYFSMQLTTNGSFLSNLKIAYNLIYCFFRPFKLSIHTSTSRAIYHSALSWCHCVAIDSLPCIVGCTHPWKPLHCQWPIHVRPLDREIDSENYPCAISNCLLHYVIFIYSPQNKPASTYMSSSAEGKILRWIKSWELAESLALLYML